MDYGAALDHLDSLINYETRPRAGRVAGLSLETMRRLTSAMGDPHGCYGVVHVTGTNGKGSTVRMAARLLQEMGLRVGAYTSPHLVEPTERISVDSEPMDPDSFAASVGDVARFADHLGIRATWFETVTVAAFQHFADVAVDVAVVEVGMLGRYDATNIVDAQVAVLTNVGLDHTDGVGDWRLAVAREKAGIVKPSSAVVCGETDPTVRAVFRAEAQGPVLERGQDFGTVRERLAMGGWVADLRTPRTRHDEVLVSLHGRHQLDNAVLAVTAVEAFFGAALPDDVVAEALASVKVPGRFEIAGREPLIVLDGAHNPDGARAAAATLDEDFSSAGRRLLVVGMQSGRDVAGVLRALDAGRADLVVACTAPTARGIPASEVAAAAASVGAAVEVAEDVGEALEVALDRAGPADVVTVAGSFTVVGAAKVALAERQ